MSKVFCAEMYARLLFDRELHDRLLTEVLEADVSAWFYFDECGCEETSQAIAIVGR